MPIISDVEAKSWKVRLVYGLMYAVLIAGAITMLYPFSLMISGSFKSDTDINNVTIYPQYWTNDRVLFQKYLESKYSVRVENLEMAWWQKVASWRLIDIPGNQEPSLLEEFFAWREELKDKMPVSWYALGHTEGSGQLPINDRLFRMKMDEAFQGDVNAYGKATGTAATTWSNVSPPHDSLAWSRRYRPLKDTIMTPYNEFKRSRPLSDRVIFNLDAVFWRRYLLPTYSSDIEEYNRRHGTDHKDYHQVYLSRWVPAEGLARDDWEQFVREELNASFIRLDAGLADAYRKWLSRQRQYANIDEINKAYSTSYKSFDRIAFSTTVPKRPMIRTDWETFVKDRQACSSDGIEVYGPRQAFEAFIAERRSVPADQVGPVVMPFPAADYQDAMADKAALRWEFTTRNYKHVLDYILLHGHGIMNTLIYITLAIGTALMVNPLAAYALSRYKPPSMYTILLFCMATMAFPAEVTMIPGFLLLKRFPLWPIIAGGVTFFVAIWLVSKLAPRWPELLRMTIALGVGIFAGAWLVPSLLLEGRSNVSLLNTFAALVLPGMANGYFIFLLKGFFDSLPRELYEAADIDGAGEWIKFWNITMNLSKPILAVIALGAFTGAYSAFMMALIIIPDQDMWTLMVWLFQLQSQSHQAVVYASLVIAAIPTFVVFVFCQNIIIRGIVVPVEK